jgi:homoserine kinase type II
MDWNELREFWQIPKPSSVRTIAQGINNLTQVLETSSGTYILRTYDSDRSAEHIKYEISVLRALQAKDLSFRVPAPILTVTGEPFVLSAEEIITLSPWLPGLPPQGDNLEQAYAAGQALAELGKALTEIEVEITAQAVPFPPQGDFEAWAGISIDPRELIPTLPVSKSEQKQILGLLEKAQGFVSSLYQTLPQQIIHRDYDQSNILMEGNVVSGILDFEFCGPDLRVLDVAYALSQWPYGLWDTGKEWSVIQSFMQGYLQQQKLLTAELEALPLILRLRTAASVFFRLGRYKRGMETLASVLERVREALQRESWQQRHEKEFLDHIHGWYRHLL